MPKTVDSLEEVQKEVASLTHKEMPAKKKNAVVSAPVATGVLGKLKAVVRKAVDCCIE